MTYRILHTTIVNDLKTHSDTRDLICCRSQILRTRSKLNTLREVSSWLKSIGWNVCMTAMKRTKAIVSE